MVSIQVKTLCKIKDGAYIIYLDKYKPVRNHCITLFEDDDNVVYFENFGDKYIPNKNKNFIGNKKYHKNVYRIHAYHSKLFGYFYIGIIDFMI